MAKFALCMATENLPKLGFDPSWEGLRPLDFNAFDDIPMMMLDRAVCETDESWLQLIPYIVLVNPQGDIFCYSRGKGGDEERLKAKLSIGLGGHIDSPIPPTVTKPGGLRRYIIENGERELKEEVGLDLKLTKGFSGLLRLKGNPVDRVHLGLVEGIVVPGSVFDLEKDVIEKGSFVPLSTLTEPATFARLEAWSQEIVQALGDKRIRIV